MGSKSTLQSLIIHPAVEPGVIDNALLTECVLENGPTDEAGRLFAEEGVHLDEAKIIIMEFKNIIRIDHLWMLKSLTKLTLAHNLIEKMENLDQLTNLVELDLSFNKITKIENIDMLVKLEVFTLFHNRITKLGNMDTLQELLIFSIGDNLIEDYKEMTYLRKFRKLRTVSFKGNPCCSDPMSYHYLMSALPRVQYLDYVIVTEEERENARALFRGQLRKLDEADEKLEKERILKEEYEARVVFYAMSFVEYLSGTELIETMFKKDPDGSLLLTFGGDLVSFYNQYCEQYVETMTVLVNFAQTAYKKRELEIKLFRTLMESALEKSIKESKAILEEYQNKKKPLVASLNTMCSMLAAKKISQEDTELKLLSLSDDFTEILHDLWRSLMTNEMQLFEQCEEARVTFGVNVHDLITKLLEESRNAFGAWREQEAIWSTRSFETLTKYLGNRMILGDASPELYQVMMDRDALMNVLASSADNHMRFIDTREDQLTSRANGWLADIVSSTNDNEIKRNRDRIVEINFFIDNEREDWTDLQMGLIETPDPENLALLPDELM